MKHAAHVWCAANADSATLGFNQAAHESQAECGALVLLVVAGTAPGRRGGQSPHKTDLPVPANGDL